MARAKTLKLDEGINMYVLADEKGNQYAKISVSLYDSMVTITPINTYNGKELRIG